MAEPLFSGRKVAQGSALPAGKPNCAKCGLKSSREHAGVQGKGAEGILLLIEKPTGKDTDAGRLLIKELKKLEHDQATDCWTAPAVACRPKDGKRPTPIQIECCRPVVMGYLQKLKPRKIVTLGGTALQSVLGHRWTHEGLLGKNPESIVRWRGQRIPDRDLKTWLYPIYAPFHVLREDSKIATSTFRRDLRNAIRHTDIPIDWDYDPEKHVRILTDVDEIKRAIRWYRRSGELVSFDYEGTGLKPHAKGHKIYSASMATPSLGAVSFPMYPDIVKAWIKFLTSDTLKTAHNMKFEDMYGRELLDVQTRGWALCTMQGAHVRDNRRGIAGIEFQTYTRLGFLPWGMDIKRYFAGRGKGANTKNNIEQAPIRSVLLYGGLDSLAQSMLAHLPEFKELWQEQYHQ
jgi:uracil-DNA glycosylase family 4